VMIMLNIFKSKESPANHPNEFVILGHLIKYNIYLLAKSVVFSAVLKHKGDVQSAVTETHQVMDALDLDLKKRTTSE